MLKPELKPLANRLKNKLNKYKHNITRRLKVCPDKVKSANNSFTLVE